MVNPRQTHNPGTTGTLRYRQYIAHPFSPFVAIMSTSAPTTFAGTLPTFVAAISSMSCSAMSMSRCWPLSAGRSSKASRDCCAFGKLPKRSEGDDCRIHARGRRGGGATRAVARNAAARSSVAFASSFNASGAPCAGWRSVSTA